VQKSKKIVCNQVYHFIISVRLMQATQNIATSSLFISAKSVACISIIAIITITIITG
jgi:hypothetical protein